MLLSSVASTIQRGTTLRRGESIDKAHDIAASKRFAAANPHFKDTSRILALTVFMNGPFAASSGLSEAHNGVTDRWTDYFMWDGSRWHAVFSQATPVNAKS